ncbi:MAG: hypothetical protein ACYTGV_03340 [Planctomycetota bacterium]|jgi:hypothetical protein
MLGLGGLRYSVPGRRPVLSVQGRLVATLFFFVGVAASAILGVGPTDATAYLLGAGITTVGGLLG